MITSSDDLETISRVTREWLENHLDAKWKDAALSGDVATVSALQANTELAASWFARLGGSGLAIPSWPTEYGGLGLGADGAAMVADELERLMAGRPMSDFVGIALAGPTIVEWGTHEQKSRFLPPLARGTERWCQLFSEPGAGSDLASLSTKATRLPDGSWRIDGQKVWNSFADVSDFGLLMARTDPSAPKHKGITYFLLDMKTPGVVVKPLKQLNGDSEFSEVFFDGAVIQDGARIGEINGGWAVAMTTLTQERSGLSGRPGVGPGRVDRLAARARVSGAWDDPVLRDAVMTAFVAERALQMTTVKAFAEVDAGAPTSEGSMRKLAHCTLEVELGLLGLQIEPSGALGWDDGDADAARAADAFLSSKILSIAGGTSEIQRNIIGERILGLPRERDPFADKPFAERPRA